MADPQVREDHPTVDTSSALDPMRSVQSSVTNLGWSQRDRCSVARVA
jgi:hypothetical protein